MYLYKRKKLNVPLGIYTPSKPYYTFKGSRPSSKLLGNISFGCDQCDVKCFLCTKTTLRFIPLEELTNIYCSLITNMSKIKCSSKNEHEQLHVTTTCM
jgi:hypothetical protein